MEQQPEPTRSGASSTELSDEELQEHAVIDLPDREAMSLITPGLGLIEGNLVQPPDSSGTSPIMQPPPSDPPPSDQPAPQPLPAEEPRPMPAPDNTADGPPISQPAPPSSQPYDPARSTEARS